MDVLGLKMTETLNEWVLHQRYETYEKEELSSLLQELEKMSIRVMVRIDETYNVGCYHVDGATIKVTYNSIPEEDKYFLELEVYGSRSVSLEKWMKKCSAS